MSVTDVQLAILKVKPEKIKRKIKQTNKQTNKQKHVQYISESNVRVLYKFSVEN